MPLFTQKKILLYNAEHLFKLVADIEHYPNFLPWIRSIHIIEKTPQQIIAQVHIKYKVFTESYICKIEFIPADSLHSIWKINVKDISGPFDHLENTWTFEPLSDIETHLSFFIDFEFKNSLLSSLMNNIFQDAASHMLESFEKRAAQILPQLITLS